MRIEPVDMGDNRYPGMVRTSLADRAPKTLYCMGNTVHLDLKPLAIFCSVKCPGNLIIKTYDLARELRDKGVPVISGFHSPMEKECLDLLLRGKQPVIWCPAKRLSTKGLSKECRDAIEEDRLLILSPFGEKVKRVTEKTAFFRNEFVSALAGRVFIAHAVPGSKTETLCRKLIVSGKPVETFAAPETENLIGSGCKALKI